ncbi:ABC transporter ATP-binding protein [candidate division LCP-89 bacterium B3_LCP]|uniref:ABC transporter ATP-binding protein n=1 Tax=candidate division LCP-89 bacterium B3_LCP TaxID=2012998 RepID=A0A532UQQ8_UNCL8|nr:MAG: ABC transporter ATP-binding protein [candidate division LCP-89 bacterium B3_LCP]
MIEIKGLTKSFEDKPVLQGVDLTIGTGESIVIIGRSGCGKSVLLKLLIGLLTPDSGQIIIDGSDITSLKESELYKVRHKFGVLFQGAALFDSMTVRENVSLGLTEHTDLSPDRIAEISDEKLRQVGLPDIQDLKPAELSGGMKKRVGLARAIAMNPQYVLYDEPTTGLDPIMADIINELVIRLNDELDVTTIAVTHDMVSAYKVADRIVMLHRGVILFDGTPEEVKNTDNEVVRQFIEGRAEGPIKPVPIGGVSLGNHRSG